MKNSLRDEAIMYRRDCSRAEDREIGLARAYIEVIPLIVLNWIAPALCWWLGHSWVDFDIGDPETGPNPEIECRRCGIER